MKLQLVGASRYHLSKVFAESIKKGEIVEVADDLGTKLLAEVFYDSANNEKPYFVRAKDTDGSGTGSSDDESENLGTEPAPKARATRVKPKA